MSAKKKIIYAVIFIICCIIIYAAIDMYSDNLCSIDYQIPAAKSTEEDIPVEYNTIGEKNAYITAMDYLESKPFSKSGLKKQLKYEGFSTSEADFAVGSCGADWKEQAYLMALDYLDYKSFSKKDLQKQLEYEGFTTKEASYGVNKAYR